MSERSRLGVSHLRRSAFVYLRQSTASQLERNVESTQRHRTFYVLSWQHD